MICLPQISAANSGVSEVLASRDEDMSESWCLGLATVHQLPEFSVGEYWHAYSDALGWHGVL